MAGSKLAPETWGRHSCLPSVARQTRMSAPLLCLGRLGRLVTESGLFGSLDLAIADADEFQDGSGSGVPQSRLGELDDPRVAAAAFAKAWCDGGQQDGHRGFVA